jgi:hypothetical protein
MIVGLPEFKGKPGGQVDILFYKCFNLSHCVLYKKQATLGELVFL